MKNYLYLYLRSHFPKESHKRPVRILDFAINFINYEVFFGLFKEIFLVRIYDIQLNNPYPLIIDCGSNIGLSVIYFKHEYPNAEIIGFEPDLEAFEKLRSNIMSNGIERVRLNNAAVSDSEGEVSFYSDASRKTSVGMSLTKRLLDKNMELKATKVRAVILSKYIDRDVDLLKIDVEGVELRVLQELKNQDKLRYVKNLIVEFHRDRTNPENRLGQMLLLLEDAGFDYVVDSSSPPPFSKYRGRPSFNLMVYAYQRI